MAIKLRDHTEFELVVEPRGDNGRRQECCRVTCTGCDAVERRWLPGRFNEHDAVAFFTRLGWQLGRAPKCPECHEAAKATPLKKEPLMTVVPMKETPKPRPLSPDEKTRVRQKLDGCFDELRGVYLDGQSDQKIGESLGIPWASVREYREIAFGPLKGNEETAALKGDIDKLAADLAAVMSRSSKEIGELASAKDKLLTRLNALEKKLGVG